MEGGLSIKQQRLAALLRATSGTIRAGDAMAVFGLDRSHASKLLAGWHKQGSLRRVAQGLYVPIQPTAIGQEQVLEDPWVLVPELYEPAYIGGWSALEHWELTEQLFRSVCVFTPKRCPKGETTHQGVKFFIKHVPVKQLFGTKTLWRESCKIQISDPYKTILDIIDDPYVGAGLQHTEDCLLEFKKIFSKESDLDTLLEYASIINNGALFKKLGYLAEKHGLNSGFVEKCHKRITKGFAHLDKQANKKRLVTKWSLWVPEENK
ncbi:type IV toxin-antitoxin system AbiEi family antitoxin domain-containing protein [Oceanicoccus sp. KOV_DT_Chl]|uniref:type IV toxin-antitoxin system AbiEi family antitoxin domain-containing protein n=1 Tax=Oceanicoccus sp. KOV_DT_Chl TaxID=1904639 RepID=UPI000C7C1F62|nr:type IV toxin-antitoxin system AbiEi family antitoxin domain-containing protein [Oceanicoccus sp. KOV_DT_Chl]